MRPDYLACGVNVFGAVGKIQAQIDAGFDFERGMALQGNAIFANVNDLVQIKHRVLRFRSEAGIRGSLNFVAHTSAAVW